MRQACGRRAAVRFFLSFARAGTGTCILDRIKQRKSRSGMLNANSQIQILETLFVCIDKCVKIV